MPSHHTPIRIPILCNLSTNTTSNVQTHTIRLLSQKTISTIHRYRSNPIQSNPTKSNQIQSSSVRSAHLIVQPNHNQTHPGRPSRRNSPQNPPAILALPYLALTCLDDNLTRYLGRVARQTEAREKERGATHRGRKKERERGGRIEGNS